MGVLKDYSRKDIVEIREYLVGLVDDLCVKYDKKWTDRNESDIGMFFIELAAGISDMLNFNIDQAVLETYLPTAQQRKNVKRILALVGYEMKAPSTAVTTVDFTLEHAVTDDIVIPKYTQLSYSRQKGNIYYATSEDCEILAGDTTTSVPVRQGIVNNVNLSVADLKNSRTIEILSDKVAYNSVRVIVGTDEWTQVDDVLVDEDYGTKFSVHETEEDHAYVEFGYNYMDYLPANDETHVLIQYIDTEGAYGVVLANTITEIDDKIIANETDYTKLFTVTNPEASSGGADRQTITEARIKEPEYIKTRNSMCTLKDYEAAAENVAGVLKAVAVDWNTSWKGVEGYYVSIPYKVQLYILPSDDGLYECSSEFLKEIHNSVYNKLWCSIKLEVLTAKIKYIDLDITIFTRYGTANHTRIQASAESAINEFFNKYYKGENEVGRTFGERITIGTLEHLIDNSHSMIDYCEINNLDDTIVMEPVEFPALGELTINVVKES